MEEHHSLHARRGSEHYRLPIAIKGWRTRIRLTGGVTAKLFECRPKKGTCSLYIRCTKWGANV